MRRWSCRAPAAKGSGSATTSCGPVSRDAGVQQDGRFSRDRYLRILKQVRLEPGSFEGEMRRQLIRKKIEDLVKDGVKVSDAELQEAYSARNQRVRMAWASIDAPPLMAGVTVPGDRALREGPPGAVHAARAPADPVRGRGIRSCPRPSPIRMPRPTTTTTSRSTSSCPGARGPYPGARAARRRQRGGEQGQGQDRGGAQAGAGRRGLRQAREGDLGGYGQCADGRRSRLREAG